MHNLLERQLLLSHEQISTERGSCDLQQPTLSPWGMGTPASRELPMVPIIGSDIKCPSLCVKKKYLRNIVLDEFSLSTCGKENETFNTTVSSFH